MNRDQIIIELALLKMKLNATYGNRPIAFELDHLKRVYARIRELRNMLKELSV